MNIVKRTLLGLAMVIGLSATLMPATAGAVSVFGACSGTSDSAVCASKGDDVKTLIGNVIHILLYAVGVAAVVVIVIGGITYTTSAGDATGITKAKNTIMYAVVGVVVAFAANSIVDWVLTKF